MRPSCRAIHPSIHPSTHTSHAPTATMREWRNENANRSITGKGRKREDKEGSNEKKNQSMWVNQTKASQADLPALIIRRLKSKSNEGEAMHRIVTSSSLHGLGSRLPQRKDHGDMLPDMNVHSDRPKRGQNHICENSHCDNKSRRTRGKCPHSNENVKYSLERPNAADDKESRMRKNRKAWAISNHPLAPEAHWLSLSCYLVGYRSAWAVAELDIMSSR